MSLENRKHIVELINEARKDGAGLTKACHLVHISAVTFRRWFAQGQITADKRPEAARPTPVQKFSVEERELVLLTCNLPEFASLPPSQIVPILADTGRYIASESTFYRFLHEASQQHDRGRANARQNRAKPDEYVATAPNQCWMWDVTWLKCPVQGMFYYLYMVSDLYSRKIVAWEVHESECGELASQLIHRGVIAEGSPAGLTTLHADNGAIQKSSTLRAKLEQLGIAPSFSRPRVSNDNAYAESLFRTLKYRPGYPVDGFASIEDARNWVQAFVQWYNTKHLHSKLNYVTPSQRHTGEDCIVLSKRHELYQTARAANPSRWSGKTRNWQRPGSVVLNPDEKAEATAEKLSEAA